jgi:hypothetical protein
MIVEKDGKVNYHPYNLGLLGLKKEKQLWSICMY